MSSWRLCTIMIALIVGSVWRSCADEPLTLVGWGIDAKDLGGFMTDAADVGFDALITGSTDPEFLARAVEAGAKHDISVFAHISPMGHVRGAWQKQYPDQPVPWQVMTGDEDAALSFITAGRNVYLIPYQWGGEPLMTNEVLTSAPVCFSSPEAKDLLKSLIDRIASVPGVGLGFDGFGYRNYHRCHCERCQGLLEEYMRAHPDMPEEEATEVFFRDMLVDYINDLADYARSIRPEIKTTIHIWPVFAPEPLYGNRLDVDYCGQTAAWYTLWPQEKIAEYSRIIVKEAQKYHERQQGVGMIGYYDRPGEFPVKDADCVDMELRTMIDNGVRRVQVCSSIHVINKPEIAEVFRRYFKWRRHVPAAQPALGGNGWLLMYAVPWKSPTSSPSSSVTSTVQVEMRLLRDTSVASAVRVPEVVALRNDRLVLIATATCPPELQAIANARSARVKMAPPCVIPTLLRCRSSMVSAVRA